MKNILGILCLLMALVFGYYLMYVSVSQTLIFVLLLSNLILAIYFSISLLRSGRLNTLHVVFSSIVSLIGFIEAISSSFQNSPRTFEFWSWFPFLLLLISAQYKDIGEESIVSAVRYWKIWFILLSLVDIVFGGLIIFPTGWLVMLVGTIGVQAIILFTGALTYSLIRLLRQKNLPSNVFVSGISFILWFLNVAIFVTYLQTNSETHTETIMTYLFVSAFVVAIVGLVGVLLSKRTIAIQ